jgi:hypothetical protein
MGLWEKKIYNLRTSTTVANLDFNRHKYLKLLLRM